MYNKCKFCGAKLNAILNLGKMPASNNLAVNETRDDPEICFPLIFATCKNCQLFQIFDYGDKVNLFSKDYPYLSSASTTFINHCKSSFVIQAKRFNLRKDDFILEVASNDGYLLKEVINLGYSNILGVEPTHIAATISRSKGIPTCEEFFTLESAKSIVAEHGQANIVLANNVFAHIPEINDFIEGLFEILSDRGVVVIEVPHVLKLIQELDFDTIYHEHFYYHSLKNLVKIFNSHKLYIFDCEMITVHGGSLRLFVSKYDYERTENVENIIELEEHENIFSHDRLERFQEDVDSKINNFKLNLLQLKKQYTHIFGYGAAAKANTLLNSAGITYRDVSGIFDKSPAKQNKFCPGSLIPIFDTNDIKKNNVKCLIVFPWNLIDEIKIQLRTSGLDHIQIINVRDLFNAN